MSAQSLFCKAFILLVFFLFPNLSKSDDSDLPSPSLFFYLEHYHNVFKTSDNVAINIDIVKDFKSEEDRQAFNPNITINGATGNSSLITGLWLDKNNWKIHFMPIMVGLFDVVITDSRFNIRDTTVRYYCTPGPIYEPGGVVSWMDDNSDIVAGTKTTVLIIPKDAFGNNVTNWTERENIYNFDVFATYLNGSNANLMDTHNTGWDELGFIRIEFVAITAGHLLVHVKNKNDSLIDSPLPLTVHPGALDVANCLAHWITDTKYFQLFSTMEIFINQRDKFHNLVPGMYEFDIEVIEKGTKLSLPIGDMRYKEVSPGIQLFSFTLTKPGDFDLIVSDKDKKVMNTPNEFSIYIGYCDGEQSIVNGSGLYNSVAGEPCRFSISLKDAYQYPSPVQVEKLQVQITAPSLSLQVNSRIQPKDNVNGTQSTGMLSYGAFGPTGLTYVPSVFALNNSAENSKTSSSEFDVVYVPVKSGVYEIRIFCGNIPLNGGRPFIKEVHPAEVNTSMSGVTQYDKKASAGIVNYITVELLDSFYNRVLDKKTSLKLDMASLEGSHFFSTSFEDNDDGTYHGAYSALVPGKYEFCVSYNGKRIQPWPFGVQLCHRDLFPTVHADEVKVWEDQSTAFDVLENDSFYRGEAKILEFQRPSHGSLFLLGTLFRYTPYKGFYGDDKFRYTILDVDGNTGSADVHVSVLTIPPQFVSSPKQLQAVEDRPSPQFGGFPSFEIIYSDPLENISLMLTAQNGSIVLSPLLMQLWDPKWIELSVTKVEGRDECLQLTGRVDVINFALKSLKYLGKVNFSGDDIIKLTTMGANGKEYLDVPITVAPINDPPVIKAPRFIILEDEKEHKGFLIFDRERDKFNFSIGDPDLHLFPGNQTHFKVMFSVEVTFGAISAKLPAHLISTTELKLKGSKLWQPLQTFVEISKHFTVHKVKGIRFLGTIDECNSLLHQLLYYGDKHDGVLKLSVNDMGWYGCYPDCSEMMSAPLVSEATVHLIARTPMNSLVAHSLGSVIVIESVVVSILTVVLMLFMCKCVIVLVREKKKQQVQSELLQLNEQMQSTGPPEDAGNIFRESGQPSSLTKPPEETNIAEAAETIL